MINGIEHTAIFAKDTKALAEWYVKYLEAEIVYDNGKGTYFVAFSNKSMIEICKNENEENEATELNKPGIRHIAISVDDIYAAEKKIKASETEILQDVTLSAKGVGTMFFRDIEGNILHFIQRPEPLV